MDHFHLILIFSTLSDALVAGGMLLLAAILSRRAEKPFTIGACEATLAAVVTAFFILAKALVWRQGGIHFFGFVYLLYLDMAVVLPLLGAGLLLVGRWHLPGVGRVRVTAAVTAAAGLAFLAAPVGAYASFIEPNRLMVVETDVPIRSEPTEGADPIRLAVLADLQFEHVGTHEREAVATALRYQPDIILLPGDIFQGDDAAFLRELPAIRALLAQLHTPGGVYVVQGDCDSPSRLRRAVEGTEVTFLYDEVVRAEVGERSVLVGGIQREYFAPGALRTVEALRAAAGSADAALLLAHRPDIALLTEADSGIDLIVAGHTHGGQVQLPGFGPLVTFTAIPRRAAGGGLSTVRGTPLYVSRGVGCERGQAPPLRLFCPPEVSILNLKLR